MVLVASPRFTPGVFLFWLLPFRSSHCQLLGQRTPILPTKSTPYDHQMARIQPILNTPAPLWHRELSLLSFVNHWIGELRAIPYRFSTEWKTPSELAHEPTGDCKGKAVALYQRMRENGARDSAPGYRQTRPNEPLGRTPGLNGQPNLQPTFSIQLSIGLPREGTKSRINSYVPYPLTLAVEGIEGAVAIYYKQVYNRVRNAARLSHNRFALSTSCIAAIGGRQALSLLRNDKLTFPL